MMPTSPPSRLEMWLQTTDGFILAASILGIAALAMTAGALVSITRIVLTHRNVQRPRVPAPSRPVSSNRKAARR